MIRILLSVAVLSLPLVLSGCGFIEARNSNGGQNTIRQQPANIEVNVPPPQTVDTSKLKSEIQTEIQSSANSTQAQMQGLINNNFAQLAQKVTGIEADLKGLITLNNTVEVKTDVKAKVEAALTVATELKASLAATATLTADMRNELTTKIGELTTKVDAAVHAQAGFGNKIDSVKQDIQNTAGRDVNYLPKEAVQMVESNNKMWMYIMGGFFGVVQLLIVQAYRNAAKREANTAALLQIALLHVHPDKAAEIKLPTQ